MKIYRPNTFLDLTIVAMLLMLFETQILVPPVREVHLVAAIILLIGAVIVMGKVNIELDKGGKHGKR